MALTVLDWDFSMMIIFALLIYRYASLSDCDTI